MAGNGARVAGRRGTHSGPEAAQLGRSNIVAKTELPMIEQRRIEASIVKSIYEELKREISEDAAKRIIGAAIRKDAIAQGKAYTGSGKTSLSGFHSLFPQWTANGALEVQIHEETDSVLRYDVVRCRYAEMYREMGLAEIGHLLSCGRDGTFCTGYDPRIRLTRTRTIMQGASRCDFSYRWVESAEEEAERSGSESATGRSDGSPPDARYRGCSQHRT